MNFVVVFICFLTSLGITRGVSPVIMCTDEVNLLAVALTCERNEMIHVESFTDYKGPSCSQALTNKTLCFHPLTSGSTGLNPKCNGQNTSCIERFFGCQAVRVDYRCIQDTEVYNMCKDFNKDFNNNFFLSTPNFPQLSPLITSAPCICSIRGTNITSINILQLRLTTASDGTRSYLQINYGERISNTTSFQTPPGRKRDFNEYLTATDVTSFTVQLNHNMYPVHLWMEIQGNNMVVNCSTDGTTTNSTTSRPDTTTVPTSAPTPVVPTPTSRQITTSPPTTTTTSCSTETDKQSDLASTNIILIVLLSLSLLVVLGIFLLTLILCRRGNLLLVKQPGHQNDDGREVTREGGKIGGRNDAMNVTTESDRNNYSQLNLSASEPVRDEPYQELKVRNSTPDYQNIANPSYINHGVV